MSDKVTDFISHQDLLTHLANVEQIIEKLPQDWQVNKWQSIFEGTSSVAQLQTSENPLSAEQIQAYEKLTSIVCKANSNTTSDSEKALALIYRAAIALCRLLPKPLAQTLFESVQFQSEYLDLCDQKINDQQAIAIAAILPCTNISTLNLMNNNINGEGAIALIKLNLLSTLNLNNNQITNDKIAIECGNSKVLREVYLDQSQFTLNGHTALCDSKYIRILSLNKCRVNAEIAKKYATSDKLAELHLDENNLDEGSLIELSNNPIFLKLSLRYNNINDKVAAKFALNTTLRDLNLSHNQITSSGVKAFANTTIENLNLSNNKLDDTTPAALSSNPNLKSTDLSHNTALSVDALKALYEQNLLASYNAAVKAGAKPDFPSLRRLSTFAVKNLPNIPDAVLEKLPADIKAYLKQHKT